jgi:hypothetical protein
VDDPDRRDDIEATALYDLIENEVAPRFYDLASSGDETGVPLRWIEMVRHTLKSLGPKVLADRMVRDYVRALYGPAARSSRGLDGDFTEAAELAAWKHRVRGAWPEVAIDHVESSGVTDAPELGETLEVRAFVSLGVLSPDDVEVQVVRGRVRDEENLVDTEVEGLSTPRPTRQGGTASRAASRSTPPARSATPSGCSRRTSTSSHPPSWAGSPSPSPDPWSTRVCRMFHASHGLHATGGVSSPWDVASDELPWTTTREARGGIVPPGR